MIVKQRIIDKKPQWQIDLDLSDKAVDKLIDVIDETIIARKFPIDGIVFPQGKNPNSTHSMITLMKSLRAQIELWHAESYTSDNTECYPWFSNSQIQVYGYLCYYLSTCFAHLGNQNTVKAMSNTEIEYDLLHAADTLYDLADDFFDAYKKVIDASLCVNASNKHAWQSYTPTESELN